MTQRYEHKRAIDKWAIVDNKLGRVIGHLGSRMVAEQVVRELNTLEAANA